MSSAPKSHTWVILVVLLGLSAVLAYLFLPPGDDDWGEPGDELAAGGEEARAVAGGPTIGPDGPEPPPPEAEPAPEGFDPARLGALLVDGGGAPVDLDAVEPDDREVEVIGEAAAPPPPTAVERAAEVGPAPLPTRTAETAPERALGRAVFWRDLLQSRIDEMRRQAEAAREAGDEARAARFERSAERLLRERPAVDRRITELEAAAPPPAPAAAPSPAPSAPAP